MTEDFIQNIQFEKEEFIQNIQFDLFAVELVIGETATLLMAENYVTIREVFVDGVKVEPNNNKQIFLSSGVTSHNQLTDKNAETAFQHVDERINEIPAEVGPASYTLLNRRQNLITGTLPNGVNSTLVIPALIAGERNEVILHFKTNATAAPTLEYSGFTPVWLNGNAISMKVNKQYNIVFEQINGIVKTSWGEY